MADFIQIEVPPGRPDDATHYNPLYTLCWEKQEEGTDKVFVYSPTDNDWGRPMNRPGGHRIINKEMQ